MTLTTSISADSLCHLGSTVQPHLKSTQCFIKPSLGIITNIWGGGVDRDYEFSKIHSSIETMVNLWPILFLWGLDSFSSCILFWSKDPTSCHFFPKHVHMFQELRRSFATITMMPNTSHLSISIKSTFSICQLAFVYSTLKFWIYINLFCISVVFNADATTYITEKYVLCFFWTSSFLSKKKLLNCKTISKVSAGGIIIHLTPELQG